jgi:ABC-type lipoprotein release transport system permease subunit
MILFDVVKLTAPGVAVGLILVIALLVAVLAGLAPARRAASAPPMVAMRSE